MDLETTEAMNHICKTEIKTLNRINIGCGQTPTRGWRNFDNSLSLRFSNIPLLPFIMYRLRIFDSTQYSFIRFARQNCIEYGDATKGLPILSGTIDALYTSHMLEHLDRNGAELFLDEAFRILRFGGIIRIAVPDLKKLIIQYIESDNANTFIEATRLCVPVAKTFLQRLYLLLVGPRNHQWMYDGNSLSAILEKHGFEKVEVMHPGHTRIHEHQPLDLHERLSESVYVEAQKPTF